MNSEKILTVSGLYAGYGKQEVVQDLTFALKRGEILCLAGESGCGKSTILKALMSSPEVSISAGEISLCGTSLSDLTPRKRQSFCSGKIGMVFQNPGTSFNPIRSYRKQFMETLKSHGKYDKNSFLKQIFEAFEKVELKDGERILNLCPYAFSGGMNQRMALALVMLLKQEVLLCDEPTSALDATTGLSVARELAALRDRNGISQIIVTHNLSLAGFLADRIGIMYHGRLVEIGTKDEVLYHPQHSYTKSLLEALPRIRKPKE